MTFKMSGSNRSLKISQILILIIYVFQKSFLTIKNNINKVRMYPSTLKIDNFQAYLNIVLQQCTKGRQGEHPDREVAFTSYRDPNKIY